MAKKKRIDRNGYVAVHTGDDLSTADITDYEYEHLLIAEELLDRPLKAGEDVHHLDKNRANNSPDNLLILSGPMHAKLHKWLEKNVIIPKPEYQERIDKGCVRCQVCDKPIDPSQKFCSPEHSEIGSRKYDHPTKETLEQLIWEKPTIQLAKELNVSDKAIEKLCKKLDVQKPPRGYWAKQKVMDIDRYQLEVEDDCIKLVI